MYYLPATTGEPPATLEEYEALREQILSDDRNAPYDIEQALAAVDIEISDLFVNYGEEGEFLDEQTVIRIFYEAGFLLPQVWEERIGMSGVYSESPDYWTAQINPNPNQVGTVASQVEADEVSSIRNTSHATPRNAFIALKDFQLDFYDQAIGHFDELLSEWYGVTNWNYALFTAYLRGLGTENQSQANTQAYDNVYNTLRFHGVEGTGIKDLNKAANIASALCYQYRPIANAIFRDIRRSQGYHHEGFEIERTRASLGEYMRGEAQTSAEYTNFHLMREDYATEAFFYEMVPERPAVWEMLQNMESTQAFHDVNDLFVDVRANVQSVRDDVADTHELSYIWDLVDMFPTEDAREIIFQEVLGINQSLVEDAADNKPKPDGITEKSWQLAQVLARSRTSNTVRHYLKMGARFALIIGATVAAAYTGGASIAFAAALAGGAAGAALDIHDMQEKIDTAKANLHSDIYLQGLGSEAYVEAMDRNKTYAILNGALATALGGGGSGIMFNGSIGRVMLCEFARGAAEGVIIGSTDGRIVDKDHMQEVHDLEGKGEYTNLDVLKGVAIAGAFGGVMASGAAGVGRGVQAVRGRGGGGHPDLDGATDIILDFSSETPQPYLVLEDGSQVGFRIQEVEGDSLVIGVLDDGTAFKFTMTDEPRALMASKVDADDYQPVVRDQPDQRAQTDEDGAAEVVDQRARSDVDETPEPFWQREGFQSEAEYVATRKLERAAEKNPDSMVYLMRDTETGEMSTFTSDMPDNATHPVYTMLPQGKRFVVVDRATGEAVPMTVQQRRFTLVKKGTGQVVEHSWTEPKGFDSDAFEVQSSVQGREVVGSNKKPRFMLVEKATGQVVELSPSEPKGFDPDAFEVKPFDQERFEITQTTEGYSGRATVDREATPIPEGQEVIGFYKPGEAQVTHENWVQILGDLMQRADPDSLAPVESRRIIMTQNPDGSHSTVEVTVSYRRGATREPDVNDFSLNVRAIGEGSVVPESLVSQFDDSLRYCVTRTRQERTLGLEDKHQPHMLADESEARLATAQTEATFFTERMQVIQRWREILRSTVWADVQGGGHPQTRQLVEALEEGLEVDVLISREAADALESFPAGQLTHLMSILTGKGKYNLRILNSLKKKSPGLYGNNEFTFRYNDEGQLELRFLDSDLANEQFTVAQDMSGSASGKKVYLSNATREELDAMESVLRREVQVTQRRVTYHYDIPGDVQEVHDVPEGFTDDVVPGGVTRDTVTGQVTERDWVVFQMEIISLLKEYGIPTEGVFAQGSRVTRTSRPDSDLDLGVVLTREQYEGLMGRALDEAPRVYRKKVEKGAGVLPDGTLDSSTERAILHSGHIPKPEGAPSGMMHFEYALKRLEDKYGVKLQLSIMPETSEFFARAIRPFDNLEMQPSAVAAAD